MEIKEFIELQKSVRELKEVYGTKNIRQMLDSFEEEIIPMPQEVKVIEKRKFKSGKKSKFKKYTEKQIKQIINSNSETAKILAKDLNTTPGYISKLKYAMKKRYPHYIKGISALKKKKLTSKEVSVKSGKKGKYPEEMKQFIKDNLNLSNDELIVAINKKFNVGITYGKLSVYMAYNKISRNLSQNEEMKKNAREARKKKYAEETQQMTKDIQKEEPNNKCTYCGNPSGEDDLCADCKKKSGATQ